MASRSLIGRLEFFSSGFNGVFVILQQKKREQFFKIQSNSLIDHETTGKFSEYGTLKNILPQILLTFGPASRDFKFLTLIGQFFK